MQQNFIFEVRLQEFLLSSFAVFTFYKEFVLDV